MIVEPDVTHRRTEKGLHGKADRRATVNVPNVAEVPAVAEGGPAILVDANRGGVRLRDRPPPGSRAPLPHEPHRRSTSNVPKPSNAIGSATLRRKRALVSGRVSRRR